MRGIVNRMAGRVGDVTATLFTVAVLLLVPHAAIRPILGYGCGWWIPLRLLALHAALTVLLLAVSLASCIIAEATASQPPEAY